MNYKRIFLFVGFISLLALFGVKILHSKHVAILNPQGEPSQKLLELLSLTDLEHDGSLASIVKVTQAEWIRKPGIERWDIVDTNVEQKDRFLNVFAKLNLIDQINPSKKQYNYALWMGATYFRMKTRLEHLITLWQQGVHFNQIVFLAGARPLIESEKNAMVNAYNLQDDVLLNTEADAMKMVYDQSVMPEAMRAVQLVVIDVPMLENKDGSLRRPTTGDTVDYWLAMQPTYGDCLVISNQPYVGYQDSVTKTLLPDDFIVETVGEKSVDTNIGIYLDTIARYLYQEKKRLNL